MYVFATSIQECAEEKKLSMLQMSLGIMGFGQQSGLWQSAAKRVTMKNSPKGSLYFAASIEYRHYIYWF